MFKFLFGCFLLVLTLQANVYSVKYHGVTLGYIDSLDTLKSYYLKAEVTNSIAKLFIGKKYFVLHSGNEPDINNAKFKRDNNMMIFAFQQALNEKPKHKIYKINNIKFMILDCSGKECKFVYNSRGKEKGRGVVTFNEKGEFTKIKEEISTIEISVK